MNRNLWISGALALVMLAGCDRGTDAPDPAAAPVASETATPDAAYDAFMSVANESLDMAGASEADLNDLVAALPDGMSLRWDSKSLDPASGATVFEGLTFGLGGDVEFGITFEQASIWGLESDLLTARLSGQRLDESGPVFTRLEGTNMSYFGVAQAMNTVLDAVMSGIEDELPDGAELGFDKLESTTDRVVLTGVSLRPWEMVPLSPDVLADLDEDIPAEALDFIHLAQQVIAVSRATAIDKSITLGTVGTMEMRQPGADLNATYEIGFLGVENTQGFDLDTYVVRDYRGSQINEYAHTPMPGEIISLSGFPAGFSMAQSESYAAATVSDLRLDKVMGYLARSELPGMDERDLLSFGRWTVSDYQAELNDKEILIADRAYFNGDQFEWLMPSDMSFGFEGATLNTGELTGFFQILFEAFLDDAGSDALSEQEQSEMELVREGVQKAIDLLPEHGLDTLPFDATFSLSWDADAGPTDFNMAFDADGYGKSAIDVAITLPGYDAIQAAYESEDRETAFEDVFMDAFAFRGARFLEEDKGGYDKLFGFAHALGKEYPDQGWGAILGNMEPAQLRAYLGTMMRMGKSAAAEEFPPAADWIESYASYLETGGSIEFVSDPPQPINKALIDAHDDDDPEPDEIVEMFGLTVTHTK